MTTGDSRGPRRSSTWDLAVAILAGILAFAVYFRSLAPGLLWSDSAEFQFAAWLGGFAHPTGYPLYLMLGWLWSHVIPLGDPAFRMNLFSALWGSVAVALLCLLIMRALRFAVAKDLLGLSDLPGLRTWPARLISFGAALVFLFTPTFWSQAVITEVYTLHAAFVAGLLLALLAWAEGTLTGDATRARHRSYLVALLLGLSLTHHRSTILLIPAAALFIGIVFVAAGRRPQLTWKRALLLLLCFLTPLALYLYIPLRAPHVSYYAAPLGPGTSLPLYDSTLAGFIAHVSGSVFSASLSAPRAGLDAGQLAGRFVDELSLNGVILGALGLVTLVLLAVRGRNARGWAVLALTGVFFLTQVAFNLFYAIGDIYVFYIPAYLVWLIWMAFGAWGLVLVVARLLEGTSERHAVLWRGAATVLALAVLLAFAYRSAVEFWPKVQRATDNSARQSWEALLESGLPQDAIVVSNDRDEMVPLWYLTYVEGRRTDLTGLFPLIQPGPAWSDVGAVTDSALATGRPVVLVKPMPGLEVKYDLQPLAGEQHGRLGPAVAVKKRSAVAPAHGSDAVFGDTIRLLGYDVDPQPLGAGQEARVTLYWQPLRSGGDDWTTFVQVLNATGDKVAQSDHVPGGAFYPTSLWRASDRLADSHVITLPDDPGPGPYRLLVGLYKRNGSDLQQLGQPQVVGEIAGPS